MKPKTAREALVSAVKSRRMALAVGRSNRPDQIGLLAAIGRAQVFCDCYPVASDERVREWCHLNRLDVAMIVPGRWKEVRKALLG